MDRLKKVDKPFFKNEIKVVPVEDSLNKKANKLILADIFTSNSPIINLGQLQE